MPGSCSRIHEMKFPALGYLAGSKRPSASNGPEWTYTSLMPVARSRTASRSTSRPVRRPSTHAWPSQSASLPVLFAQAAGAPVNWRRSATARRPTSATTMAKASAIRRRPRRMTVRAITRACHHKRLLDLNPVETDFGAHSAWPDRPRVDPQLLHHRAHRPWQVDACRPHAADHRRGRRPFHACPIPRQDGHRARTRHHDQVAGRAAAVGRPRAQHDRHPGARRLHLRGVQVAAGVRGRDPAGRRGPGHRGADAGQPLPGHERRPAHHPRPQQDRPARRAAGEVRRGARGADRLRPVRCAQGVGQDRRGRARAARPRRADRARARRRRRLRRPGADLRLRLRHLPRRGHLRPRVRRPSGQARAHPDDVHQRHPRDAGDRRHLARAQGRRPGSGRG